MTIKDRAFLEEAFKEFGNRIVSRKEIYKLYQEKGLQKPRDFLKDLSNRVSRGMYQIPTLEEINSDSKVSKTQTTKVQSIPAVKSSSQNILQSDETHLAQMIQTISEESNLIPKKDPLYVEFGAYKDLKRIIGSRQFFPVFVTGLSGNGKTHMINQICAELKRELFRINITIETDEDDLLGGFRLVGDTTKWFDGPMTRALKSGGVVLIDEVDLGSNKIMCIQSILEGNGIFLKKINQYVYPKEGFTIIATANTKGQGNETGKFVGTNLLNEAFLERFNITIEQDYPSEAEETKILKRLFKSTMRDEQSEFVKCLTGWARNTRDSFKNGTENEVITTRRLIHIAKTFSIFQDREKAVKLCLARFDESTQAAFWSLYEAIDPSVSPKVESVVAADPLEDMESILGTNVSF